MMVCLAVKQLMFYERERVLDNLFSRTATGMTVPCAEYLNSLTFDQI
jgi:hypothetical protein